MKIKNLFEKTDVHTPSGDWKHESPGWMFDDPKWTEEAYNQFQDEDFVKRLKKVFDKLPFDVVIMPINEEKSFNIFGFGIYEGYRTKLPLVPSIARFLIDIIMGNDTVTPKEINLKKINQQVARFIGSKIKKDNMVVMIASNFLVEDNVNVTPWMIAHGISHATEYSKMVNPNRFDETVFGAVRKLCYMTSEAYGFGWKDQLGNKFSRNYDDARADTRLLPPKLITPYFTFKTARDNDFIHSGEFYNESFAQFMITGRVKINKELPETLYGKKLINPEAIDTEWLERFESAMNEEFTEIANRLKGKVVVTYDE